MVLSGFGIEQIQRGRFILHCAEAAPYLLWLNGTMKLQLTLST